ncbi:unnamed protein product [Linum trigynum]|uniref:Myb-like domain-containing protein n=1 Tax=Linum trigynum TaxID=586398 RepID=A0AAV2E523_9ROSI
MTGRRNADTLTTPTLQDGRRREMNVPPRRSTRLRSKKNPDPVTLDRKHTSHSRAYLRNSSEERVESGGSSLLLGVSASATTESSILGSGLAENCTPRRSTRLSLLGSCKFLKERAGSGGSSPLLGVSASGLIESSTPGSGSAISPTLRRSSRVSLARSCTREVKSTENGGKDRSCADGRVVLGLKANRGLVVCGNDKESRITGKRKRIDDGYKREEGVVVRKGNGREKDNRRGECVNGWTREQELALQRAYFSEKPTPHFWKKVAKLVPGKSAQDCFDKVHGDYATPPQPTRRSRAKVSTSSPIGSLQLSACKILDSCGQKTKRCSTRQKHHIAQKTVRQLLQKHNHRDQNHEADLFSILEPDMNPSAQDSDLNLLPSTPKTLQQKQMLSLENSSGMSSSGHKKKPLSRFSNSCQPDIISPLVLKQVKDRFLHEKYIDRLHCREAKRKAAASRLGKSTAKKGKENAVAQTNILQNVDVIRAAKNALSFDVSDAINQLRHLESDSNSDSSDFNGDAVDDEDD